MQRHQKQDDKKDPTHKGGKKGGLSSKSKALQDKIGKLKQSEDSSWSK